MDFLPLIISIAAVLDAVNACFIVDARTLEIFKQEILIMDAMMEFSVIVVFGTVKNILM